MVEPGQAREKGNRGKSLFPLTLSREGERKTSREAPAFTLSGKASNRL